MTFFTVIFSIKEKYWTHFCHQKEEALIFPWLWHDSSLMTSLAPLFMSILSSYSWVQWNHTGDFETQTWFGGHTFDLAFPGYIHSFMHDWQFPIWAGLFHDLIVFLGHPQVTWHLVVYVGRLIWWGPPMFFVSNMRFHSHQISFSSSGSKFKDNSFSGSWSFTDKLFFSSRGHFFMHFSYLNDPLTIKFMLGDC